MKIVIAPDSFKGSISAPEAAKICAEAVKRHIPNCETVELPIADGGEGTLEILVNACSGSMGYTRVQDPLGREIDACFGMCSNVFIVEMARASGLTLVDENEKNPMKTSSVGTGQLIRHGLDLGYRKFIVGIGGSATNDAGTGMLHALGARFRSRDGEVISPAGEGLSHIYEIDVSDFDERIAESEIEVMCDVDNPLTGKCGATYTYARQKGANSGMIACLEAGMVNFRDRVKEQFSVDLDEIRGAGAAGGIGGALSVFCKARLRPGVDTVLGFLDFSKHAEGADFVITAEGRIDSQSMHGKAVYGVAAECKKRGIPAYALCGGIEGDIGELYEAGIKSIMPITRGPSSLQDAIENAEFLLADAADRLIRFII